MKGRLRARVWVRRVILCLVMGAVVNVLVAWGCAIFFFWTPATPTHVSLPQSNWPPGTPSGHSPECDARKSNPRFGFTIIDVFGIGPGGQTDEMAIRFQFGLPLRALEFNYFQGFNESNPGSDWGRLNVSPVINLLGLKGKVGSNLPVQPIPMGFALNSLLYAACVFSLTFGLSAIKRKRLRSKDRCVRCGYDVAGVERCPECGEVV